MFFKNHLTKKQAIDLFKEIKSQTNPDLTNLKRLVNFHKASIGTTEEQQALNLKYQAMTHVQTTIEKTMTPAQLYDAGCPLWAIDYSIERLTSYFELDSESLKGESIMRYMNGNTRPTEPYISWKTIINKLSPSDLMSHHVISGLASSHKKGTVKVPPNIPPQ